MIRAKELAQLLGVSAATVSLVLNNKPGICECTRNELRAKITEMGYGYMFADSGESEPKSESRGTLGFVVYPVCRECSDTSTFYAAVMEGASSYLREQGYQMVVIHRCSLCKTLEKSLNDSSCLGFIVQKPCLTDENAAELRAAKLPFVMVDTYYFDEELSSVSVNNEQGVYKLLRHLKQLGHERIGYTRCDADRATFCERQEYYRIIMSRLGLNAPDEWFLSADDDEGLKRAVFGENPPTAFLTDNDMVAFKLIKKLKEWGIKVPEDISVCGFEDREIAAMSSPAITTVKIPDRALGRAAARELLSQITADETEPRPAVKIEIGVELILRESTAERKSEKL